MTIPEDPPRWSPDPWDDAASAAGTPPDGPQTWVPQTWVPQPESGRPVESSAAAMPGSPEPLVPEQLAASWTEMEQQLRADEALSRAFAQYEREAARPRARPRLEPWRAPVPAPVRAPRADRSPVGGWLVIVCVVLALLVGYDRWGGGRVDPTLTVPMSDLADMPKVTSLVRPPAGFEEQRERLLPEVSPLGLDGSYEFLQYHHQMPVTWSPCRPIRVVVDTARAPDDFVDWVGHVLGETSELTGLQFVLDGPTTERVSFDRESYQPDRYGGRWAPVIIGFADAGEVPGLAGNIAGLGGAAALESGGAVGYVTGVVALDTTMLDVARFSGEPGYVQVLRHEVGHLLGLDHVEDRAALMHPGDSSTTTWGPGDRAGLAVLGAGECQPNL